MAVVWGVALARAPVACAGGGTSRSTLRRRASPRTGGITGSAPAAPVPATSGRQRHGMSFAIDGGVPVCVAELPRRGLVALADLPAVEDQVVPVGHAVDPDGTEGVAGD